MGVYRRGDWFIVPIVSEGQSEIEVMDEAYAHEIYAARLRVAEKHKKRRDENGRN